MLKVINGQLQYVSHGDEPMFNNPVINSAVADPQTLVSVINNKASKATAHIIPPEEITGETDAEGAITGGNVEFTIADKAADLTQEIACYNGGARVFNFSAENVDGSLVITFTQPPLAGNDLVFIYSEL